MTCVTQPEHDMEIKIIGVTHSLLDILVQGDVVVVKFGPDIADEAFLVLDSGWIASLRTGKRSTIGDLRSTAFKSRKASKATLTLEVH